MMHSRLEPFAPHAWALLSRLNGTQSVPKLVDTIARCMTDTVTYQTQNPEQNPCTVAAALLIVADQLPEAHAAHALQNLQVYVDNAWHPLTGLYVRPVPVAEPEPAPVPLLDSIDALIGEQPRHPVNEQVDAMHPLRSIEAGPALQLPALDFDSIPKRMKRSPFDVESENILLRGSRPKWWTDMLDAAPRLLAETPAELIGGCSRGPARIAASLTLVRLLAVALDAVPPDVPAQDLKAWLTDWQNELTNKAVGEAVETYANTLMAKLVEKEPVEKEKKPAKPSASAALPSHTLPGFESLA